MVFGRVLPAFLVRSFPGRAQRVNRVLPGSCVDRRIGHFKIRFGDLEIENSLALRLILRLSNLIRGVCIIGAQTGAPSGLRINAIETATAYSASDETVTCFHTASRNREDKPGRRRTIRCND